MGEGGEVEEAFGEDGSGVKASGGGAFDDEDDGD